MKPIMQPIIITQQVIQKEVTSELPLRPLKSQWTPTIYDLVISDPDKKILSSAPLLGVYQSHPIRIDPREEVTFEFSFWIRAKSPDTTYSATVALKNSKRQYIDRLVEKGWFHWDYPIMFRKASAIWMEQPEIVSYSLKKGNILEEAEFIQFGLVLNHNGAKVVYQIREVCLKKK